MDTRDSLDRSSAEGPHPMPASDGYLPYNPNGDSAGPDNLQQTQPNASGNESSGAVDAVLQSDIGINTLLTRLKQSVASAREFAAFLKKRSTLEEEHAQGLKKICKSSHESSRRPDNRQGSYAQHYNEVIGIHDRLADNGVQFALSIHQMHEDLHDLAVNIERGRKQWKQTGLSAEKRVQDSEALMERAKAKYDSLADDYDRARTGDKQSGRVFGLKGPKSAAQHEEDLNRKMQAADADYASKVQTARSQRQELISTQRPQAVKAILDLINECDAGLTLQLQKFASFNEKLLLGNGLCVSPLKGQNNDQSPRSLRDVVFQIDNTHDLNSYISSFSPRAGQRPADIRYQPHPSTGPTQQAPPTDGRSHIEPNTQATTPSGNFHPAPFPDNAPVPSTAQNQRSETDHFPVQNPAGQSYEGSPHQQTFPGSGVAAAPPQLPQPQLSSPLYSQPQKPPTPVNPDHTHPDLPPLRPVFGVSLEELLHRDGSAIPLVVYQCLQAVELFGLDFEGIYRLSGSAMHISKLRAIFDHDPSQVDFRNPESFFHDVNSVAGLLKQFFRELPDPLFTHHHFQNFIEAAHIDDDVTRRDSIHAIVNSLPDPNYATLRALTLHLYRVQEHSSANRMNSGNLAICFGPTLMGTGSNIADAGWQVRVIETILHNTYQIFDDD
ncbi:Rho GTPase-activating protein [Xanthoria parietina]